MQPSIDTLLNEYLELHAFPDEKPFLRHLDYFKGENGLISACSISEQQSKLSGESTIKTAIIGKITVSGANNNNPDYVNGTCPWKKKFQSDDMLHNLKHPCDTNIVNRDGSINIDILKDFVKLNFEFDKNIDRFVMKKSTMIDYLSVCKNRDADLEQKITWYLPSFEMLAHGEWSSFFDVYADRKIDGEIAVTLNTFLQFYFEPDVLNQKVLTGTLGFLESESV